MLKGLARGLLTAVLCMLLVGFGLCGAAGIYGGIQNGIQQGLSGGVPFVLFGLLGIGIAWICWRVITELWRKPSTPPPPSTGA